MGKFNVDKIVSLILEKLNETNQYIYIDSLEKYPELFQAPGVDGSEEFANKEYADKEMALAEKRERVDQTEKLPEPMRIPADALVKGARTPAIPKIACMDPQTNEIVENMVISDVVLVMPSGDRVLAFQNYGETAVRSHDIHETRYVVLPDAARGNVGHRFMSDKPRSKKTGNPYEKADLSEPENETPEAREIRITRIKAIKEGNAKRYGIFPVINEMFSRNDVLDHLDVCLIPEPWAGPNFTEHTTNKSILKTFGGATPDIDCDFIAVRDLIDVESAINEVMDLRMALAMGPDDPNMPAERKREVSQDMPRQHANYIYKGGNWEAKQRVHDPEFFKKAGGKTPVYELLSKNIQEGLKTINVKSALDIKGSIEGDDYVLRGVFKAELNCRNLTSGKGESAGELFNPILVNISKPLEGVDPQSFTLEQNTEFFVDQGRTNLSVGRTGFLPDFIGKIGDEIKNKVDPDEVLQRMSQLVQMAVDAEQ